MIDDLEDCKRKIMFVAHALANWSGDTSELSDDDKTVMFGLLCEAKGILEKYVTIHPSNDGSIECQRAVK